MNYEFVHDGKTYEFTAEVRPREDGILNVRFGPIEGDLLVAFDDSEGHILVMLGGHALHLYKKGDWMASAVARYQRHLIYVLEAAPLIKEKA